MKKSVYKILSVLFIVTLLSSCTKTNVSDSQKIDLYFVSNDGEKIVCEERNIIPGNDDLLHATATALLSGPVSPDHKRVIPQDTTLLNASINGTVAEINFSSKFDEGTKGNRLMSRYTAIYTFCALPGIKKVKLLVEGNDLYSLSTGELLQPLGSEDLAFSSPTDDNRRTVTLYFSNHDALFLTPETRQIEIKEGETVEEIIVKEIIKGPQQAGNLRTVSEDVKVLSAETKANVCFVNLSQEFVAKNTGGSTKELMAVYSIVNSLCQLDTVKKVRFLIEGETVESFGSLTFNDPFTEDKSFYNEGAAQ